MQYFKVGDQVVQNPGSQNVLAPPRKGVVFRAGEAGPHSAYVDFGGRFEEVEECTLSLSDPDPGTEVVLWQNYLSFPLFVTFGKITETSFAGKSFSADGQFTPLRTGLILTRPSSPEHGKTEDVRESTRFLAADGRLVRQGDVVRRVEDQAWLDDVVLWDYSRARWFLCPITADRRLAGRAMRGLEERRFEVVGHVHFIPPFDTGLPVDDRLFPSDKLLQHLD